MVMRCVLKHHVCLCVLSTAVLAGLALITAQTKVYAQSKNCNGIANPGASRPGSDSDTGRIECDGGGMKDLSGKRTIDMSTESGSGPAVKVHNGAYTIISDTLIITDKGQSNINPAIQVEREGTLILGGHVDIQNVYKGIEVSGGESSVTVTRGVIGVREGEVVFEVTDGGKITLNEGVTVKGGGRGSTGMEVVLINNGGDVVLGGTNFSNVKTGIKIMGTGKATTVRGGGATVFNLVRDGTGIMMQRTGRGATVIDMTFQGSGGGNMGTGAVMGGGWGVGVEYGEYFTG
ncbi:hypothetical protein m07a_01820 [Bartonella schoenbuchensis m07a]|uniref:Right handed beta helix domain-containing protein n=2 Tax=Bartonella schoenbuchensis TaxID=165694 RepID=N6VNS6_9HYPH|nr:hypothetical protein m07a_01820 [Bartonella schoenbuchensis m07a]